MTNSGPGSEESRTEAPPATKDGPSPELVERFRQFEARVNDAVRLIAQLKQDRQRLEARLEEATRVRAEAVKRIDDLIDKIDGLL